MSVQDSNSVIALLATTSNREQLFTTIATNLAQYYPELFLKLAKSNYAGQAGKSKSAEATSITQLNHEPPREDKVSVAAADNLPLTPEMVNQVLALFFNQQLTNAAVVLRNCAQARGTRNGFTLTQEQTGHIIACLDRPDIYGPETMSPNERRVLDQLKEGVAHYRLATEKMNRNMVGAAGYVQEG